MKKRIDLLLVESGLCESREKARRAVLAGQVYLDTDRIQKASTPVDEDLVSSIHLRSRDHAVSRSYYKLAHALEFFSVQVIGRTGIDVGSSTGGFTQRLLESGATKVYAVDCGTNQLDYRLRRDVRVCVMERTNARFLQPDMFDPQPDLAVMDVSFISSTLLMPVIGEVLHVPECVVLVKPQFEAGRDQIGKGGIVREPAVWSQVLEDVIEKNMGCGYICCGLTCSPVTGTKGNVEFLALFRRSGVPDYSLSEVVASAQTLVGS